ncbi:hypothetical protein [Rufibacter sp. XAAS-G3-1]|uniref:hypothetical protein n=1 Tax=Rufibacter sp. XAAS-G3-1 TaxID=2729134 RepID=UPI0015E6E6CA|nr:hypothetical protein [Rufibacter sp. XAAS-G3-1]
MKDNPTQPEIEFHITANGYDLKTGKYSIPECYVKATGYIEAAQILSAFLDSGAHADRVNLVKEEQL